MDILGISIIRTTELCKLKEVERKYHRLPDRDNKGRYVKSEKQNGESY